MGISGSLAALIDFILGLYVWLILIRVLLSWVNPDPYNPIVQFLVRATEPVLRIFRRWIPSVAGLDLSPVVALLAVQMGQQFIVGLLRGGLGGAALVGLLGQVLAFAHLFFTLYLLLLLVRAGFHVHAWHTFRTRRPMGLNLNHPLTRFVFQVTEPAVRPLRAWIPTWSGLDITPLIAVLVVLLVLSLLQGMILAISGMGTVGMESMPVM